MELAAILAAIEASCDGKQGSDDVQVPADVLLAAQQELKGKAQMAKDLEMARDEASMKPSVARKLNEKIRGLEAELEELRSNKKVKELEKKVQFLEHELKQSYTTKNFTLKSGLLELEKQYRPHMNVDPNMAAFWDDITVLLDEKKDRDTFQQHKGHRVTAPSAAADSRARTPRTSATSSAAGAPPPAAAAGDAAATPAAAGPESATADAVTSPSAAATKDSSELEHTSSSTAVQAQVDTFNTIISEEAASAATLPADLGSSSKQSSGSGEVVVRHGAGFRVLRPAGVPDPHADATAADGSSGAAAAAAAAAAAGDGAAQQQQQRQQSVALLRQDFASRMKDVTFHAMPASQQPSAFSSAAAAGVEQPPADAAVEQQSEAVSSRLQELLQQFGTLAAGASALPLPPDLTGSSGDQQQQQSGEVDTASLWQHQLQQLLETAQQLQQQHAEGARSADALQQQEAAAEGLLESVSRMQAVLQGHCGRGDADSQQALAAALESLAGLQQELQLLLQQLRRAAAEAGGQRMLVSVFGQFLSQLEKQGVLSAETAADSAAAAASDEQQQEQQPALLSLLQNFLQANPQVPQMLAVQFAPAVPPKQQQEDEQTLPAVELSSTAVQASPEAEHREVQVMPDAEHREVQAVADAEHREVQAVADAEHREVQCETEEGRHAGTQCEPREAQHAGTQSEPLPRPSDHVETQTEAAAPSDHAGTQTDSTQPSISHVSTQAAAQAVSAEVQTTPPSPVAAAVQAELRPEMLESGSQADLPPPAAAGTPSADGTGIPAAAGSTGTTTAAAGSSVDQSLPLGESRKHGSGIIYSASGSELSADKAAVGQQLDILHQIERSRAGDAPGEGEGVPAGAAAVVHVKAEELTDLNAVAKELGQLRADNMELAASLQVTQSLVDHLNSNLKAAIDKADDAEAEAVQVKQQLDKATAGLEQLQNEHADLTHVLIEAKVELAEKKGELLKLVREIKRWRFEASEQNAAGVVNQLENILAVVPGAADDSDAPQSPATAAATASRSASSFEAARHGGLAGLAAGLGHMREALGGLGSAGRARPSRLSDSSSAAPVAGAGAESGPAAVATGSGIIALARVDSDKPEK